MSTVWFITGSSRGLGAAITEWALAAGDRVVATARNAQSLQHFVERYGSDKVLILPLDVTDYNGAVKAAADAIKLYGRVDILVNNAGWSDVSSVEDQSMANFEKHISINFYGVVNVTKAFIPHLRRQGSGHIFQIASVGDRVGTAGQVAYQSAKWAVCGFSTGLAHELGPFGIKITVLEPGRMLTDFSGPSMTVAEVREEYKSTVGWVVEQIQAEGRPSTRLERVATVIKTLHGEKDPPLRLLLGEDAVMAGEYAANSLKDTDEKWKHLSTE